MIHLPRVAQMVEERVLGGKQPDVRLYIVGAEVQRWFMEVAAHTRRLLRVYRHRSITDNHYFPRMSEKV